MTIAYQAPAGEYADALYAALTRELGQEEIPSAGELVRWEQGTAAPAEVRVLLLIGSLTRELMESLPDLELVQVLADGYEKADLRAATEMGIWVSYSPADQTGNADAVAEFTVLLLLGAARQMRTQLRSLGEPDVRKPGNTPALVGKTVCVVGPGSIGSKVMARLLPFGVRLTAVARTPRHAPKGTPTRPMTELKEAVAEADFVVLTVRATAETEGMIDAEVMASMKPGAVLVNVARGSLVDEAALYQAVRSGHLGGAGLDVLEHEPVRADEPLLELPQVLITPHVAGQTDLAIQGTAEFSGDVVRDVLAGRRVESLLNQPDAPRRPLAARSEGR